MTIKKFLKTATAYGWEIKTEKEFRERTRVRVMLLIPTILIGLLLISIFGIVTFVIVTMIFMLLVILVIRPMVRK